MTTTRATAIALALTVLVTTACTGNEPRAVDSGAATSAATGDESRTEDDAGPAGLTFETGCEGLTADEVEKATGIAVKAERSTGDVNPVCRYVNGGDITLRAAWILIPGGVVEDPQQALDLSTAGLSVEAVEGLGEAAAYAARERELFMVVTNGGQQYEFRLLAGKEVDDPEKTLVALAETAIAKLSG